MAAVSPSFDPDADVFLDSPPGSPARRHSARISQSSQSKIVINQEDHRSSSETLSYDGLESASEYDYYATTANDNPLVTPGHNTDATKTLRQAVKDRVILLVTAIGTGNRCLITLALGMFVEFCHMVARATKGQARLNLEYHWGFFARTLNLDSSWNIIRLTSTFHTGMDGGVWEILAHFQSSKNNPSAKMRDKPFYKKLWPNRRNGWEYIFLDLDWQPDESIHRLILNDDGSSSGDYQKHSPPFTNLIVKTHSHPFFVIAHAGKILEILYRSNPKKRKDYNTKFSALSLEIKASISSVRKIWMLWSQDAPEWFTDPRKNAPHRSKKDTSGRPKPQSLYPDREDDGSLISSSVQPSTTSS
ncbi:hypothetical protein C8J56DRAFT_1046527 [Mycena floridula]|nr:hypothetical protein C8J56DRAFT_1046525 [Mycena floridula]KAJ7592154.1 hypothetical protein C8J56DRAFT_1046527 [Mycena floridula]